MNEHMVMLADADSVGAAAGVAGATGFFLLCIVIVWQVAATWRARMLAGREEEYRKLAARYAELLEDSVELQRRTAEDLAQTRTALASVEKMMREID
ncbi:hypothetical protein AQ490_13405 [Wenjunlia vitaminophila]|uniref:Uncharacterized protein n=1 Tax=Wenjunlia vitaminophila TaxID=76728 RepID=A0A0T6LY52_WENVI|nr:hypothetical protein [Wenjunlia vitaminophila]KRV50934.1 hypothetical protein AQ490_13405 [Wenjunlia vitaminophila]